MLTTSYMYSQDEELKSLRKTLYQTGNETRSPPYSDLTIDLSAWGNPWWSILKLLSSSTESKLCTRAQNFKTRLDVQTPQNKFVLRCLNVLHFTRHHLMRSHTECRHVYSCLLHINGDVVSELKKVFSYIQRKTMRTHQTEMGMAWFWGLLIMKHISMPLGGAKVLVMKLDKTVTYPSDSFSFCVQSFLHYDRMMLSTYHTTSHFLWVRTFNHLKSILFVGFLITAWENRAACIAQSPNLIEKSLKIMLHILAMSMRGGFIEKG